MRKYIPLLTCILAGLATCLLPPQCMSQTAVEQVSWANRCTRVGNDDITRPFEPSLKAGFINAYKRRFPENTNEPEDFELKSAVFRCMDGHLLACFVGVNLPCGKLEVSRENRGAVAYCRHHPEASIVPMAATGHDTIYFFTCSKEIAEVSKQNWNVDRRGFGIELWKPMN
jgi:hypothetical protein